MQAQGERRQERPTATDWSQGAGQVPRGYAVEFGTGRLIPVSHAQVFRPRPGRKRSG